MYENIYIIDDVMNQIKKYMNNRKSERGGIIGTNNKGIISSFFPDVSPESVSVFSYSPNTSNLEHIINGVWSQENIEFAGFIHSHMNNGIVSKDDILYIRNIMKENNYQNLLCGILNVARIKYEDSIQWYAVSKERVTLLHKK